MNAHQSGSEKIKKFWNELQGRENSKSKEEWFDKLAAMLMNDLCLVIGQNRYRIVECEFYYTDIDHQDPYVHGEPEQMTAGKLYYNKAGGIDITFGNEAYPAFGGILIRGIRNLQTNKYTTGVVRVLQEFFIAIGNVILERNTVYFDELTENISIEKPIKTFRRGLKRSDADTEVFFDKPYRYIIELVPAHKFSEKERVVKQLLSEGQIESNEVKDILSYSLK